MLNKIIKIRELILKLKKDINFMTLSEASMELHSIKNEIDDIIDKEIDKSLLDFDKRNEKELELELENIDIVSDKYVDR